MDHLALKSTGILLLSLFSACRQETPKGGENLPAEDVHSFARPAEAVVTHLDLELAVDFKEKRLTGTAVWKIRAEAGAAEIVFDTYGLEIDSVSYEDGSPAPFSLGEEQAFLGRPLKVQLREGTGQLRIRYRTGPDAPALQWLEPEQTDGKTQPFLFTQSQAILARSWIPCQDSPGIRFSYTARVQVPQGLMALMSAKNPQEKAADGRYSFEQTQPIPSYLMALAAGDLAFRSLGRNTGVYAEPSMIEKSAFEFADMQEMMDAAEKMYGTYRWGRYDVLVLPPSFPFGGMENPELTFATPTIIAGDRSLVSLVAHELAHSWSGNLVTNANWNDFWLNEGFTVYFERRIMEAIEGKDYADMLALIGFQDLQGTIERLGAQHPDTRLKLDLKGRNPDDGVTDVAYEKGFCLLKTMEAAVGRERFDVFLREYFNSHAFRSMTTESFIEYYRTELLGGDSSLAGKIRIEEWIYEPGLPGNHPRFASSRFEAVDSALAAWKAGSAPGSLNTGDWSTHEWLHFIRHLPDDMTAAQMKQLDEAFSFTGSGNSELLAAWFMHAIRHEYAAAYPALESFLVNVGRRKFLLPLYTELTKSPRGREMAGDIYKKARPNYHFVSRQSIDELLGLQSPSS